MPSGLKGTSHSFPQSAQVALCISLLPYDIFAISTPTILVCKRALHSIEIDKVETYKLSAFFYVFYGLCRLILVHFGWYVCGVADE